MSSSPISNSYAQILKDSSLIGGAQGINLLLGMIRVKASAVLIGLTGVGLIGSYGAIQGVVGTVAGLGIQSSGVREVAEAVGTGDQQAIGRVVLTLHRMCWLTGFLGMLVIVLLSPLLSRWTFGPDEHTVEIALLGVAILFGNLSGGQMALIQGMRRIGDLARLQVTSAIAGTVIAVGCYAGFGLHGIVPALLLMAMVQLAASWYFARQVSTPVAMMAWRESFQMAGGLVQFGLVFMWNGLIVSFVSYITIAMITRQVGLEAVGIYNAAFALSGMFVSFVLNAMGADYYPRLTAVASDREIVNRLVNEQTEIGLLLAVPGLLATMCLAPWIIHIFYTSAFLPAADLLQWFILGCLGRILSWPLGFVMLALGKGRWLFVTETLFNSLYLGLIVVGLVVLGLEGAAIAFFILYVIYTAGVYMVARHLTGFVWSPTSKRLLLIVLPMLTVAFIAVRLLPLWPATVFGVLVTAIATVFCLRGLMQRVDEDQQIMRVVCWVPGMRWVCGV